VREDNQHRQDEKGEGIQEGKAEEREAAALLGPEPVTPDRALPGGRHQVFGRCRQGRNSGVGAIVFAAVVVIGSLGCM
jgi:hypothetical protein